MPAMTTALVNDGLRTLRLTKIGADLILSPKGARLESYRIGRLDQHGFVPETTVTWLLTFDRERAAKAKVH